MGAHGVVDTLPSQQLPIQGSHLQGEVVDLIELLGMGALSPLHTTVGDPPTGQPKIPADSRQPGPREFPAAYSLAIPRIAAPADGHRGPCAAMKTVRRPPYPKWNPGYFPCSSLTPPSACPSVDSGLSKVVLTESHGSINTEYRQPRPCQWGYDSLGRSPCSNYRSVAAYLQMIAQSHSARAGATLGAVASEYFPLP